MSHRNARMAFTTPFTTRLLISLNRSCFFAGLGVAVSSSALHAQENPFRFVSKQSPADTIVPQSENAIAPRPDDPKSTNTVEQAATTAKNRDIPVLQALTVPNTSIRADGMNSFSEDLEAGRLPSAIFLPYGPDRYGVWALESKTWIAPVFCHQPLYFEDVMLERHGQERRPCLQPLLSGTRFFSDIVLMPYHAYLHPPLQERASAGHYRPGSIAPCLRQRPPYDAGAIRFQLLTTGTVVLAGQP